VDTDSRGVAGEGGSTVVTVTAADVIVVGGGGLVSVWFGGAGLSGVAKGLPTLVFEVVLCRAVGTTGEPSHHCTIPQSPMRRVSAVA